MNMSWSWKTLQAGSLAAAFSLVLAASQQAAAQTEYKEAPALAALVASGDLPPVQDRLGFLGPSDHNNYTRVAYDALVRFSPTGGEVIPHIAKGWESNADFTQWTVSLRKGMKWSDGEPFTADDIMFWYNSIL